MRLISSLHKNPFKKSNKKLDFIQVILKKSFIKNKNSKLTNLNKKVLEFHKFF